MVYKMELRNKKIAALDANGTAKWIHMEEPTDAELEDFKLISNLPAHIIKDVADPDEMPHLDKAGDADIIFLDIPIKPDDSEMYETRPMCIVMQNEKIYTITNYRFDLVSRLKTDFVEEIEDEYALMLVIIRTILSAYIEGVREMEQLTNFSEADFKHSKNENALFLKLLNYQKSLIEYETSVESNHSAIESMKSNFELAFSKYHMLLIDNLLQESEQIEGMCAMLGEVLGTTASIAETIVSNNLNSVIKGLTSLSVITSIPVIVIALYTMNPQIPEPYDHFVMPIIISLVLCLLVGIWLKIKRMF